MSSKVQTYMMLAGNTAIHAVSDVEAWQSFLVTASRMYKYSFGEQLLIHAQRPDATACAEYGLWKRAVNRYVKRGSKGIALIDNSTESTRLRYVFDISDTNGSRKDVRPVLWEMKPEHEAAVSKLLENEYGATGGSGLAEQIVLIAEGLAGEYLDDNQDSIQKQVDKDDNILDNNYEEYGLLAEAIAKSTAYVIMCRCGINPNEHLQRSDFNGIANVSRASPVILAAMGTAVSDLSEQVIRQIEATVKEHDRKRTAERSKEDGEHRKDRADLHTGGRRTAAGHSAVRPAEQQADRQVREHEASISEEPREADIRTDVNAGDAVSASAGGGRSGTEDVGAAHAQTGQSSGSDRGTQSQRPNALGGPDEQLQGTGGGDNKGVSDLRLTPEESAQKPKHQQAQISLFADETDETDATEYKTAENETKTFSAVSFPWENIDRILIYGGNNDDSRITKLIKQDRYLEPKKHKNRDCER